APTGRFGEPVEVTSFSEFEREFGQLDPAMELGYAVRQFFDNGGLRAWVVRARTQHAAPESLAAFDAVPILNILCLPGWAEDEVRTARAGTEAGVRGNTDIAAQLSEAEVDELASEGVNAIRSLPGAGVVVWGARTVAGEGEWKYVPIRRLALFIEESLYQGL